MVVVEYDLGRRFLAKTEFLTGLVPELVAVSKHLGSLDAIHHDNAVVGEYGQHLCHDFFKPSTVAANEDSVRVGERIR